MTWTEQDEEEAHYVAMAMWDHGGSFVKKLSELINKADPINKQKIKKAWPAYWASYKAKSEERQLL